ncbi:lactadherin [Exaiptasia diaphana]|uniref:F5/8 type C domain-containing protein n=1 Tax=Exaiptasia diaphana TaxID=2652724 RepID=A0A913X8L5_EXADI|nr:lactadherin [Exaiptasia diaphana]
MMSFLKVFFLFVLSRLFNSSKSDNSQVLKFDAANISKLRDPKTGFGLAKFIKVLNKTLHIPPFKILQVKAYKECLVDCAANRLCISLNFYKIANSQGLHSCELLASDYLNNTEHFLNNTGYHHFTTKVLKKLTNLIICHGNSEALGMNDFRINNSQITASTYYGPSTAPWNGRLNTEIGSKGWAPQTQAVGEYLQIDFGKDKMVSKVATQGRGHPGARPGTNQYVTKYSLQISASILNWVSYNTSGAKMIFPGNTDMNTVVSHTLSAPFVSRYVRFVVEEFNYWPAMRVELYGCG